MLGSMVALAAALLYSLGGVMQHRAIAQRSAGAFDTTGLRRGIAQPQWVLGLVVMALALGVQLVALALAPLALVQTIMTTMVFWVLPLAVLLEHVRPGRTDYVGSVIVAAGVVAFLLVTRPGPAPNAAGSDSAGWAVATALGILLFAGTASAARFLPPGGGAGSLGAGAGVLNVLGAGLASASLDLALRDGASAAFGTWLPYGAALVLIISIGATAMAFAAGPVTAAMPPMIAANPVVGLILGVVLLNQTWAGGTAALAGAAVGVTVIVVGTVLLSRSRIVADRFA